jgi:hypothetical protein
MAEVDPLDELARLARQEDGPPCDVAEATMRKVRAARRPHLVHTFWYWKPAVAFAAAAALAAIILLPGPKSGPPLNPLAAQDIGKAYCAELDRVRDTLLKGAASSQADLASTVAAKPELERAQAGPAPREADAAEYIAPLDLLGSLQEEVKQLMKNAGTGAERAGSKLERKT